MTRSRFRSKGKSTEPSEDELALDFADRHPDCRWVQTWGIWLRWDGNVWNQDSTLHVFDTVRKFLRETSWMHDKPKALRRASTVAAVEKLARSDRRYAASTDQWDQDPMLLNTPGGVIDLTTSCRHEASPDLHMTKITSVEVGNNKCPRWLKFLDDIAKGDDELVSFIQRIMGYCLTGDTREHALFFLHGSGANGKSTLLNVLTQILGDYAKDAPMVTFPPKR